MNISTPLNPLLQNAVLNERDLETARLTLPYLPKILPAGWVALAPNFWLYRDGLKVSMTVEMHEGKRWIHTSCSRESRMPSYDDLTRMKTVFIGPSRKAVMVLPAESEHFSFHPFCLHLFSCLDGDGLPDFRIEGRL